MMRERGERISTVGTSDGEGRFHTASRLRGRAPGLLFLIAFAFILFAHSSSLAQAKRLVVIKVDGLPMQEVDSFVRERDPKTGKSRLPWIDYVFYQRGKRVPNFYTRGMSL